MSTNDRPHHNVEMIYDQQTEAWNAYLGSEFIGTVTVTDGMFRAERIAVPFVSRDTAAAALAARYLGNAY